jgi:glycerol-3-phosphate dehydrogenase (NAD(P)+)
LKKIAVLGAGSWGIAISVLLHRNNNKISLWEFLKDDCQRLNSLREHPDKLPGIKIPAEIEITNDLQNAVTDSEAIVFVVPSPYVRQTARSLSSFIPDHVEFIVNLAKGIEYNTLCRMSEVLLEELPDRFHNRIVTLSGPSHAEEVSRNIPTTVVAGSLNLTVAEMVQQVFNNQTFRVYTSTDLIGVELGGSLKNVIAIAAGMISGLGLGDNTLGALMTRGLAEMVRLGQKMGAEPMTFAGLSGIGDLITTCTSRHSRNRYVGEQLGKGKKLDEILSSMKMVAEGVNTTRSAYQLAEKHGVEMPISIEVYNILFAKKDPQKALFELMTRSPKTEIWE